MKKIIVKSIIVVYLLASATAVLLVVNKIIPEYTVIEIFIAPGIFT